MKKKELNFRFHNPNPIDITVEKLLEVFVEVNLPKVEQAIREEAECLELQNLFPEHMEVVCE